MNRNDVFGELLFTTLEPPILRNCLKLEKILQFYRSSDKDTLHYSVSYINFRIVTFTLPFYIFVVPSY